MKLFTRLTPLVTTLLISLFSLSQEISREAEGFYNKALSQINRKHVQWISSTSNKAVKANLTEGEIRRLVTEYGKPNSFSNMDIEAMIMIIMMQVSNSAQEDLKEMLESVKKTNSEKQKLRELQRQLDENNNLTVRQVDSLRHLAGTTQVKPGPGLARPQNRSITQEARIDGETKYRARIQPASKAEIDNAKETVKKRLDSISEMGEMESLRLQNAMERKNQFISIISNIMKKISDSQDTIIQNLK